MKKYIKLFLFFIICIITQKVSAQIYTQTYVDKCTGEIKTVTTTYVNGNAVISFYNQTRVFTPTEVSNGTVQTWLNQVYAQYNSMACPTSQVVQQTVQNTVSQAASAAASSAASSSASSAASSSASSATSTSSNSNNSSSSQSNNSSSSESKNEQKTENKTEESKSESKEESKSESKEEKKDEKKEEKKKNGNLNPMLFASDLTASQNPDNKVNMILGLGWSRSSMAGDETFSINAMVWSNLKQFALGGGYTKTKFINGSLNSIHSYGTTFAYLDGNYMNLMSYTYVKPNIKHGTYGYNIGIVNLLIKNTEKNRRELNMITSAVAFWTKPYQYSKKVTLSPQTFILLSPLSFNSTTGKTLINKHMGFLLGGSVDYKISKRFGLGINYKLNVSTMPKSPILQNILIGSRLIL